MTVILEVNNVSKIYKRKGGTILKAVDGVSFSINSGEIVGFLGPNGAGKSTTIKIIAGLAEQTEGNVTICGSNVRTDRFKAMASVGGVIESPDMYGNWSGMKNLCYLASISSIETLSGDSTEKTKDIIHRRVLEVLDIVGLTERKDDLVKKYSLGMKQRLGIAQALMNRPKLLILDEPANGLDPEGTRNMRDLLKKLAHEFDMAILVSSHQLAEMQLMCDRFMIIKNGKIVAERTIDELNMPQVGDKQSLIVLSTDNAEGVKEMLRQVFGIESDIHGNAVEFISTVPTSDITKAVVMNGFNIFGLQTKESSLEDVFINATNVKTDDSEEVR